MLACLLSLFSIGAPIPTHLFPPSPPEPIRPGFTWWYCTYHLQAVKVEGEQVWYRCLNAPGMTWGRVDGPGISVQTKETTRNEVKSYYQVPLRYKPDFPQED